MTEGAEKSATTGGFTSVTATPKKAQVTMRFNEEVQWADEDHQLNIISQLAEAGSVALSRALDLGLYHRINPLTGTEITAWDNYVGATEYTAELSNLQTKNADGPPRGLSATRTWAWAQGSTLSQGLTPRRGDTVSGRPEATTETGVRRNR
ncbi:hypothetical protein [Auritidibacter ignavus]|uniref:hypothetical protein n=1 Tax=Auritidibacter ignavus TaxID=678932 RepID=UPI002447FB04|nr:hypothetical protein [Auritidibacter ignavus]WGH83353.1 hypothetical protein QDX20_08755 [Auritidibacter ignavus]WHS29152.1 hypothetical protein QM395_05420 [Auritidibacter ignavus]